MQLVLIGCVAGVFFVFTVCVIVLLIKSRQTAKRNKQLFMFDPNSDIAQCKSAPVSRQPSPTLTKKYSSPNLYGALGSLVIHQTPHGEGPCVCVSHEHVQPGKHGDLSTAGPTCRLVASMQENIDRCDDEQPVRRPKFESSAHQQGRVWFCVHHDARAKKLTVTLVKLDNLPGRSSEDDTRDPFVKMLLLPDEHTCKTSKIVRKSLHPVYNERFVFDLDDSGLCDKSVRFSVYDVDTRRVRHCLGHVLVPVHEVDVNSAVATCRGLVPNIQSTSSVGEMNIGLTFQSQNETLKVIILRTRHIRSDDVDAGLYVNLHLFYGPKHLKTKRTLTQRIGPETCFNESFSFATASRHVDNINFRLTLVQESRDTLSDDLELGHVTLGTFLFARGSGLLHWQEMLSQPRTMVTRWHQLGLHV